MMMLGLAACFMQPNPERKVFGPKTLLYTESDMLQFLCSKEAMPVLIPNVDEELMRLYLDKMDGIILQGGSDIVPETYGEKPIDPVNWPGDRQRDRYEFKIMDYAREKKMPVLGLCRGMQLINVYYGGTLYQDLKYQGRVRTSHRDSEKYDTLHHKVDLAPGGILARAYKADCIEVNSVHHQGVKSLGEGLICEARSAEESLIEGLRHSSLPHWGVQWHPEFNPTLGNVVAPEHPIIDAFIASVREYVNKNAKNREEQNERHQPRHRRTNKRDQIRRQGHP